MNKLFTDEELEIYNLLSDAWNKYLELPQQHPDDINEFRLYIHQLQEKMLCRPVVRLVGKSK
jgi:hypothetical protein